MKSDKIISYVFDENRMSKLGEYYTKLVDIIYKYKIILLLFLICYTNPALFSCFFDNDVEVIHFCLLLYIPISLVCLVKAFNKVYISKRNVAYFLLLLGLIARGGFGIEYTASTFSIVGLSIISLIIFCYRKYFLIFPFICLVLDFIVPSFINEYMLGITVIYALTREDSELLLKDTRSKLFGVSSFCIYFIGMIRNYLQMFDDFASSSMLWQYYNDYFKFGFITRGFVATIRYIIMGNRNSYDDTFIFMVGIHTISALIIIAMLLYVWKNTNNKYVKYLLMALVCSEAFRNIADGEMLVYFDSIMVCCLFAMLLLITYSRCFYLIPFILLISMCIHHGFAIFLFPILFVVLCYKYLSVKRIEKRKALYLIFISVLEIFILFGYFHFISYKNNKLTYLEACEYISSCLEREIPEDFENMSMEELKESSGFFFVNIDYVMYDGKMTNFGNQDYKPNGIINSCLLWILLSPFFILMFFNFGVFHKKRGMDYLIAHLAPFSIFIIAMSYLEVDCGRWNGFLIFSLLCGLIFPNIIREESSCIMRIPEKYRVAACKAIIFFMIIIPNMGVWSF